MPSKKHKPEEIIGKLREVEIVLGQGGTTAEACRRIAVSEQTYYRWRKEYGGLKTDQARRMKDLEKENLRLRRAISDLTLDTHPSGGRPGKLLSPARRRRVYRSVAATAPGVRKTDLPGVGPASIDASQGAAWDGRRAAAYRRHHRSGQAIWSLRLSPGDRLAARCRLDGEPQAGGADLAQGGAQDASAPAEARPAMAQRRVLHPAAAGISGACLGLRLRRRQNARRAQVPDPHHYRRG